jgi:hypothetical protein
MMLALAGEALAAVVLHGRRLALDGAIRPKVNKTVVAANNIRIAFSCQGFGRGSLMELFKTDHPQIQKGPVRMERGQYQDFKSGHCEIQIQPVGVKPGQHLPCRLARIKNEKSSELQLACRELLRARPVDEQFCTQPLTRQPMSKADEFRLYAEEAMRWAEHSTTEKEARALRSLARTWAQAALEMDAPTASGVR